ncbi:MAG: histidine phosphatase family protein [Lachnospiraceae bacterium]|nr:histidine phosphatase family protein [Lachnospiraceae bacterium]
MERKVYLVRHGKPDLGEKEGKVYLGRKDVPLLWSDREHFLLLGQFFHRKGIHHLVSSPLLRCRQSAELVWEGMESISARKPEVDTKISHILTMQEFQEIDTGLWDGCSFAEIRQKYPEEYEKRGLHPGSYVFPAGESPRQAGLRFFEGMKKLLIETEGNLLVMAHAGVIRSFLCIIQGKQEDEMFSFSVPYGSVTELSFDGTDWRTESVGSFPSETMTEARVKEFWDICGTTERQRCHMRKTAAFAMELLNCSERGHFSKPVVQWGDTELNLYNIYYGCLLHDLKRSLGRNHEELGGQWLEERGYGRLAELVRRHNDPAILREGQPLSEEELLYYADKRVKEDLIVSVEERFAMSRSRIKDETGRYMHEKRKNAALHIEKKLRSRQAID